MFAIGQHLFWSFRCFNLICRMFHHAESCTVRPSRAYAARPMFMIRSSIHSSAWAVRRSRSSARALTQKVDEDYAYTITKCQHASRNRWRLFVSAPSTEQQYRGHTPRALITTHAFLGVFTRILRTNRTSTTLASVNATPVSGLSPRKRQRSTLSIGPRRSYCR